MDALSAIDQRLGEIRTLVADPAGASARSSGTASGSQFAAVLAEALAADGSSSDPSAGAGDLGALADALGLGGAGGGSGSGTAALAGSGVDVSSLLAALLAGRGGVSGSGSSTYASSGSGSSAYGSSAYGSSAYGSSAYGSSAYGSSAYGSSGYASSGSVAAVLSALGLSGSASDALSALGLSGLAGTSGLSGLSSLGLSGLDAVGLGRTLFGDTATRDSSAVSGTGVAARLTADGVPADLVAYGNGRIPPSALAPVEGSSERMWRPAAEALNRLIDAAAADGVTIGVTDGYRSYESQAELVRTKGLYSAGGLAAAPGTSEHGWGMAADLALDSSALTWMRTNAGRFGFAETTPRESWHWSYRPASS